MREEGDHNKAIDREGLHPSGDVLNAAFRLLWSRGQHKPTVKQQLRLGIGRRNSRREQIAQVNELPRHDLANYFRGNGGEARTDNEGLVQHGERSRGRNVGLGQRGSR